MNWTTEQVLNLAPDTASAKAGQGLANARKWQALGHDDKAAWGLCQGSGKDPYQTQIELAEPAFKCSCPSRKFPCKHGLALLLLLATQGDQFKEKPAPDWVNEWLANRAKRSEQKAVKAEAAAEKPVDEKAQAKRIEAREKKVADGLADLQLWMNDLIRHGLAHAQTQPYSYWERPAARLVDAQAPGLARLVRELAGLPSSVTNDSVSWQSRMLARLGALQLALNGYQRIDTLPTVTQSDLRQLIGWTINQDELLAQNGVRDLWLVIARRVETEDRLRVQRSWLWGLQTNQPALILHFAHSTQPLDISLVPGQSFDGELVFFPSGYQQRALIKQRNESVNIPPPPLPGFASLTAATEAYAKAIAQQPWLERFPFALRRVTPQPTESGWLVADSENRAVALHPRFSAGWELLALSGGYPVSLFGEWDGDTLWPLCVQADNQLLQLTEEANES
jgi:SWIM zinc finger